MTCYSKLNDNVYLNVGNDLNNVAFVFSCPGNKEEVAGHPCAGQTGDNLDILLKILNKNCPEIFKYNHKKEYRITNSSTRVFYNRKTKYTEDNDENILNEENLKRLNDDLIDMKYVICCGRKAKSAISKLKISYYEIAHLSNKSLNVKYKNIPLNSPKERRIARINKEAELLLNQIKK